MTIQAVKALFISGQTETGLQKLMEFAAQTTKETHQSAILLRASWEFQEKEAINGTLTFEEANAQRLRITKGALDLITDFENDGAIAAQTQSGLQRDLWNSQTSALMQIYDNDQTAIHSQGDANIIVGQGNSINQKKVTGFGIRQFVTILLALVVLGGGGYWAYKKLFKGQDKTYASLSDIQKELSVLADLNGSLRNSLEKNRADIEAQLAKGMKALDAKDYPTAIRYLEKVAEQTPASSVYQNIAYAYEQVGKQDKAKDALSKAKEINPNMNAANKSISQLKGKTINVLAAENGGKIFATSDPKLQKWTDGDEKSWDWDGWVVYGFKDNTAVKVNELRVLVPESGNNTKEIKLSYSNESPTATFIPIQTIKPFNGLLTDSPYQKFSFPPVSAKYLKVEATFGYIYEIQILGTIE